MFCSTCGAESTIGLNYCKRCGTSLSAPADDRQHKGVPTGLVALFAIVIAFLGLVGLMAIIEGGADLAHAGVGGLLVPIIACGAAVLLGVETMLVWVLMRLLNSYGISPPAPKLKKSLPAAAAQLAPPPHGFTSVTEHTTRHFEGAIPKARDTSDMN
jgi:hypothetical protein